MIRRESKGSVGHSQCLLVKVKRTEKEQSRQKDICVKTGKISLFNVIDVDHQICHLFIL